MTVVAVLLCVACQVLLLWGQLLFKRAMAPGTETQSWSRMLRILGLGIATQTVYIFLWLGLMQKNPLSKIYPFEGLNPALLALLAWIVLKERLSAVAWCGLGMICVGIAIATTS